MTKIVIGKAAGHNVAIDLQTFLASRLLIQADSGGGKTYLLGVLCEQLWGKVQVIIIDPEGEFATLREQFGFVLVGKGGDTPADPRSAALLAQRLLEHKASAICDIYEMKSSQRHEWVRRFLDAMIDAPKSLWHPVVVIVDEAHMFCPEKGMGESEALESMVALCTRGRKRGFCAVFATQRLSNLSKSASGMLLNRLIGPTFESGNITRAADELGIPKSRADRQEFVDSVKLLEPGHFYALGRAISRELVLVKIAKRLTTHPQVGVTAKNVTPPPPPANIAKLLPKLSDLPKEAEEKARTESELRKEVRTLHAELRRAQHATPAAPTVVKVDEQAIRTAIAQEVAPWQKHAEVLSRLLTERTTILQSMVRSLTAVANSGTKGCEQPIPHPPATKVDLRAIKSKLETPLPSRPLSTPRPLPSRPLAPSPVPAPSSSLSGPEKKILVALAKLRAIGKDQPTREMVAGWAGYSPNGSAFTNPLGALRSYGYIEYPGAGVVSLTQGGLGMVGEQPTPTQDDLHGLIREILTGPEHKILKVLLDGGRDSELSKQDLADKSSYSAEGSAFTNPLGALRSKGFVVYPKPGFIKPSEWLFLE